MAAFAHAEFRKRKIEPSAYRKVYINREERDASAKDIAKTNNALRLKTWTRYKLDSLAIGE